MNRDLGGRRSSVPSFDCCRALSPVAWLVVLIFLLLGSAMQFGVSGALSVDGRSATEPLSVDEYAEPWMKAPLFHSPVVFAADYAEMKRKLRIFVYPHAANNESRLFGYNAGMRVPTGNYASEHYFFLNLHETGLRTDDPGEAHFFALPFSVFNLRMAIGPGAVAGWVERYMSDTVRRQWPYWNRTGGADHFYGTCHDLGVQAAKTTPGLSGSAIQIICPANRWDRNYIPTKDFSFPQVWPRYKDAQPGGLSATERMASGVLAFWSGSQNSKARALLRKCWNEDDDILLGGGRALKRQQRGNDYFAYFRKAKYCLHVVGYQVHTSRIADAIYFGCVPVILSDQFDLPFKDVLDWRELSVIVVESQIPHLKAILNSISDERYKELHDNVETVRRHFTWNSPPEDYDIFYMTMYNLWLRRFSILPALDREQASRQI